MILVKHGREQHGTATYIIWYMIERIFVQIMRYEHYLR